MTRPTPPLALADTSEELEAMFYDALRQGRLEQLMALWADEDEIVCVHPGGGRDIGAAAIRASFEAIFTSGGGIPVQTEQVHRLQYADFALHHLVERIDVQGEQGPQVGWVLSTNLYVKTDLGWRIAAHHASAGLPQGRSLHGSDAPSTLH
jgi:ketosteroid isomerase-like protein